MILGAGLLVLVGLGLLVAGVVTGVTALYWACVAVCVVAAVLLFLVRRQISAGAAQEATAERETAAGRETAAEPETAEPSPSFQAAARRAPVEAPPVEPPPVEPPPVEPPPVEPGPAEGLPAGATALGAARASAPSVGDGVPADEEEPPLEEVEVTDLLVIVDLHDEVLVIDEHPRYHLAGCSFLTGRTTIPLPLDEARGDGFTPCGTCSPDRTLARRARARK